MRNVDSFTYHGNNGSGPATLSVEMNEETLSDGSKVYDIKLEIDAVDIDLNCETLGDASGLFFALAKACGK